MREFFPILTNCNKRPFRCKTGQTCPFNVSDGRKERLLSNFNDRADTLTQSGLNLIQQALSIYDRNLKLAVSNSRFREMFNLPEYLTIPGADFAETLRVLTIGGEYGDVEDIDAFVREKVEQALAFEAHYVERTRANGRTISIEGSPLRQGGWVAVYTDITAIKRQERLLRSHSAQLSDQLLTHSEELARTNRELAATIAALEETKRDLIDSEALTRSTSEMMPAHIAHVDLNEIYTYSNRKLPTVLPGRPSDIVGQSALDALGHESYSLIAPYLERAFNGTNSVFEFTQVGTSRRVRAAFTPEINPDGNINGVYILSTDVTEEAQSRAALMQTHKRELAAQLTSGLAHDFANLLTIILGLQGRLEKLKGLPVEAYEMITTTRAAALRGGVLLDRVSNISGQRELHPTATDIRQLLSDIQSMATPSLPDNLTLEIQLTGINAPMVLDAGFLQDSLLNIILNARDAMAEQPGSIQINAQAVNSTWLEIVATDTGPGFSKEALENALDPFFTSKRNDAGSGLGLTMVYDFAQMSGGHVKIANAQTKGAIVTLRLPLKRASAKPAPRMILLVEDSPDIRAITREMLRDMGHSVIEATSAEEAETLATIPGVTTILSDISIDGQRTGLDLGRAISGSNAHINVFLMTSLPPSNSIRRAAEQEFPLIAKPFSAAELSNFLETEVAL